MQFANKEYRNILELYALSPEGQKVAKEQQLKKQHIEDQRRKEQSRHWVQQGLCRSCGNKVSIFGGNCISCGELY
jgi:hypothetical protein